MAVRTKIICTIGPACNQLEAIMKLMQAGMNVARLNFSHGTQEEHQVVVDLLKEARRQLNLPLAIMIDLKGPEMRIGKIKGGSMEIRAQQTLMLTKDQIEGDQSILQLLPDSILADLQIGTQVLFDDGYLSSRVIKVFPEGVEIAFENSGRLLSNKGVNIPNVDLKLPACTPKDIEDVRFACRNGIEIIAASFVRSADHILLIKKLLAEENKPGIILIAKIENREGVENFDSIVQVADGIMVARGDLGVEVPLSEVPILQKMMIRKSYLAGKPSVTATQMLESMIYNPRPTRAEVSDVANAIYDSTSAVMLSGETAIGKYPIEAVNVMKSIIFKTEEDFNYEHSFNQHRLLAYHDVPSAVALAVVKTAYSLHAKAIFAFTSGGSTARLLSRLRPEMPIVAITSNRACYEQLSLNWGVIPLFCESLINLEKGFELISDFALKQKLVDYGDLVVITVGVPFGISGTTNMMIVESIGNVLVQGQAGHGQKVYGKVTVVLSPQARPAYTVYGSILVITHCDETYLSLIQECKGVILQNNEQDSGSVEYLMRVAKDLDKPFIVQAKNASQVLREGQLVTLDPIKAAVFKGVVV